jgi:hypothetical protein
MLIDAKTRLGALVQELYPTQAMVIPTAFRLQDGRAVGKPPCKPRASKRCGVPIDGDLHLGRAVDTSPSIGDLDRVRAFGRRDHGIPPLYEQRGSGDFRSTSLLFHLLQQLC